MIAATLALPARDATAYRAEDEAIERARAVLDQAGALTGEAVSEAREAVKDAIEMHEAIRAGVLGWEAYDTDLLVYAADSRHDIAVQKSAEDAEELAGVLAEVIGKHEGEQ